MNHRDAETRRLNIITEQIIGSCIEIHRALGPGLLESAYEECLCHELALADLSFERQKALPVVYKDIKLACGYRIDLVVEGAVIVEVKSVERLLPVHEAQLLTYLKLTGVTVGLLVNFHVPALRDGLKRMVNDFDDLRLEPSSPLSSFLRVSAPLR